MAAGVFSRVMSQSPSSLEALANTAKPGESGKAGFTGCGWENPIREPAWYSYHIGVRGRWLPKQPRLGARIPSVSPWRLRTFDSGISKINYYKVLENRKKFLCKRMWERSLIKKSVHNSWIFFIKSDKKKRKQIEKVTKTLDFIRVWGMLTNLRKKIKWNHRKARAKKANR